MYVKDYEFISNIDALFEKTIIIYGLGEFGKRTAELLDDISVAFDCFCDRDKSINQKVNHPVISLKELKKKTEENDCLIIVGSYIYCDEIIHILKDEKINAYICTWYGIRTGIELNLNDMRLPKDFTADFIRRKKIWTRNFNLLLMDPGMRVRLSVFPSPILIYQPGKVGSMTVNTSLMKEKIDVMHIHHILHCRRNNLYGGWECVDVADEETAYLIAKIKERKQPLKVITLIRDPVARALADFMQRFSLEFLIGYNNNYSIEQNAHQWINKLLKEDYELTWWFDKELKEVTGIDVYDYPFDKEQGCTWIKEKGVEILLLTMEKLNENADILGEFVGKQNLKLVKDNVGSSKQYKYIYEELKRNIKISDDLLEQQYKKSRRVDHFYTENEKQAFFRKWKRG